MVDVQATACNGDESLVAGQGYVQQQARTTATNDPMGELVERVPHCCSIDEFCVPI